jgi:signal transduction histidine kinase/ActR/RegA family two-component response regulator
MTTIADWGRKPPPIQAAATLAEARSRFLKDADLGVLVVVDGDRPVGLLARAEVMDEDAKGAERLAGDAAALARLLAAETPADEAMAVVLAEGGLVEPLVLVEEGRYCGLITAELLTASLEGRGVERSQREHEERRDFIETLAREVRTPITGVLAVAGLLQRQPLTADAQAYVQTIMTSTGGVLRLLDEALDLALGEKGRLQPQQGPVRLRALMDEIQSDWDAQRAGGAPILVSYDGDPDLGVTADGPRLRQVFDSLIASALKSTRLGAVEARLTARAKGEDVWLEGSVRDAGPGLPPEQLARIFDPTAATGARTGWTGLGPALSRRIMDALSGTIRAESNIGEGVTVTFQLLAPRLEVAASAPAPVGRIAGGNAVHVLVVDDNATNRMVAQGLCEMFDCTSECAEDGHQAVEAARNGRFDLILMDIKMPRMDGLEATRAIRALSGPAGKVPIIALTANADAEDAKGYVATGMCAVVEKPIKPDRLLVAINAALNAETLPASASGVRAA